MLKSEFIIKWIQKEFGEMDNKIIIGISGGKDSTICAGLLVKALGKDRVIGVLMPNGEQTDINDSHRVIEHLGIESRVINISHGYDGLMYAIANSQENVEDAYNAYENDMIKTNLPSRLRMATLYAVAALYPGSRVVNTSNWSERYIGYSTKYGDGVGDFSLLCEFTVREVLQIGDEIGLPYDLVHKVPSDGMSGKSDEERIGFTYDELDDYLLNVTLPTFELLNKIEKLHAKNLHKIVNMKCPSRKEYEEVYNETKNHI